MEKLYVLVAIRKNIRKEVNKIANPQLKDGYTRIATELLEELAKTRMSGETRQVLDVIMRKTYGYHKAEDKIAVSQFARLTGLSRRSIFRSLEKLKERHIIGGVKNDTSQVVTYRIQKDYDRWKGVSKKTRVSKSVSGGDKKCIKLVSKMTPTIDNTIDNNTIDTTKARSNSPLQEVVNEYYRLKDNDINSAWCKQQYARHCKPAKHLLEVAGELPIALANLKLAPAYFKRRKLSWTLETVVKCWPEICKEKEKEVWM